MDKQNQKTDVPLSKPPYDSISTILPTSLGKLHIRGPVSPENLEKHSLSEGLCCFRPSSRQHSSLVELSREDDGMIFTASLANIIVSYAAFQKPDYPWWQERCFPELIELGSIETDPSWRKMGISNSLMENLFHNKKFTFFDDFIVIAVQFIQSWDLKTTGMSPWAYRDFMVNFFKKFDFVTWETVDPEIREHPSNILVARVGKNICDSNITLFSNCCLGTN